MWTVRRRRTGIYRIPTPLGIWRFPRFGGRWEAQRSDHGQFYHRHGAQQEAARRNLRDGSW